MVDRPVIKGSKSVALSKGVKKEKFSFKGEGSVPKAFNLPIQTVTLVPSTKEGNKKISKAEFNSRIKETENKLTKLFGGFTKWKTEGGIVLKGKVVKEDVGMVTSFSERSAYREKREEWITWVREKRKEWGQKSMGVIIENDLMYVK